MMAHTGKVGIRLDRDFVVTLEHSIQFRGGHAPPMLSTPSLILELEITARDAISPYHPPEDASVGTFIELEHLAATPVGARVQCTAKVIHIDRSVITFAIEASDGQERIAKGIHKRRIVSIARFSAKLNGKAGKTTT